MAWLSLLIITFFVVTFTARLARERGRSGWLWATASTAVATSAAVTTVFAFMGATILLTLVVALLGSVAMLGLLRILPERVPRLRSRVWPVYRLSSKTEPAGTTELAVEGGVLRIGAEHIAAAAITTLEADGECLRIVWAGREAMLTPAGDERNARERIKKSQALAARIRRLLG